VRPTTSAIERRSIVAVAALSVLLGLYAMNDVAIGVFQDDGHYLILARALAQGAGYHYTNLPGAPAATHFPPGYPLLLAPLWWIAPAFPANVAYFKLINVALLPLAALSIRAFMRRVAGLGAIAAASIAVLSVASVPLLYLTGLLFSEIAFIVALCWVLILVESRVAHADGSLRAWLFAGIAVGALALLRTVGITLLPALLAVLCLRRRWREAGLALGGALVILLPWQWWTSVHAHDVPMAVAGAYGGYGPWLAAAWHAGGMPFARAVVTENLRGLLIPMTLLGLAESPMVVQAVVSLALAGVGVVGARSLWPRTPVTVALFVPYLALLLIWPFPPDRFLWPLWPFALLLVGRGFAHVHAADQPRAARHAATVAAVATGAMFAWWHAQAWSARSWETGERANARIGLAAAGVALALPTDGLVASDQDAMVHLYASRPAVPLLALTAEQHVRSRSDDELAAQIGDVLDAYRPRWVLVIQRESLRGATLLAKRGRLKLRGADPSGVLVYDVLR
jgi:hypothetical protein